MNNEAFKVLEFNKIREMLAERAGSMLGKEKCLAMLPTSDYSQVIDWQSETAEAVNIYNMSTPPLGGIFDIRPMLKKASMGAALTLQDITDLLSTMYAMRSVKRFFKELELEAPILKELAKGLEILGQLERQLDNTVDEHGNMRDDASVELKRIRREIKGGQGRIKEKLSSILHSTEYQKYFQDNLVTMRDDRYVIPVKQEYKGYFPGIVHDRSATGSTLFIEPMAVVDLNNDVKQLIIAERHEVERILRVISQTVGKEKDNLIANVEILAEVDFVFAKAKLARDMMATQPLINDEGRTVLKRARHPLIDQDKVVPIDISLGNGYRMLLVTGPNTGGKTVSMKTLGLMVLMVQSGCFIPAAIDSEIGVYRNIYADIGDEQSIEQSLSTFSAHMSHLVKILGEAQREDLLLLDELGAGTDPEEGAALAMAILEKLLEQQATVVATTHYSELKSFAYTRSGIENACVEFDIKSLKPTYRLLTGVPGASNAFAISRRLGLANSLVLRAQQLVQADHAQFENVINQLEKEKMMYEQMNADIQERQQKVKAVEAETEALRKELYKNKGEIIRKAKEQSSTMIRRTRREAEEIIDSLKEQYNDMGIKKRQQAIADARKKLDEAASDANPGIMAQKEFNHRIDLKKLRVGDTVYVRRLDQKGTVLEIKGKELEVLVGSLTTRLKINDCRFVSHKAEEPKPTPGRTSRNRQTTALLEKTAKIERDIDIRGMMVDEAEMVLGKFIDDAVIAGMGQVLIIHGKGTGALRKGVHAYLKNHRNVLSYKFADMDEGGTGATIVELK